MPCCLACLHLICCGLEPAFMAHSVHSFSSYWVHLVLHPGFLWKWTFYLWPDFFWRCGEFKPHSRKKYICENYFDHVLMAWPAPVAELIWQSSPAGLLVVQIWWGVDDTLKLLTHKTLHSTSCYSAPEDHFFYRSSIVLKLSCCLTFLLLFCFLLFSRGKKLTFRLDFWAFYLAVAWKSSTCLAFLCFLLRKLPPWLFCFYLL